MMDRGVTRAPSRRMLFTQLRRHLRDTFWFPPAAAMAGVFVVWLAAEELDSAIVEALKRSEDVALLEQLQRFTDDAKNVVSTVSSAMMTFIGVVFSISLVAVQMASGQFTPRVVRLFVRSRISKATFAVFLATFVLTLLVMTSYDSAPNPQSLTSVPLVQSALTLLMVGLSLLLFVFYVNATLRLMRVGHVIARIARESLKTIADLPETLDGDELLGTGPPTASLPYRGQAGVLQEADIVRLVAVARKHDTVLQIIPRVGDFLVPGTPVLTVHGATSLPDATIRNTVAVGVERTTDGTDLAFGLRQLSDIALRALSPAVNDPTTAVQALDRIVQLLAVLGQRPLGTTVHRDRSEKVRLLQPLPSWTSLVDLGLAEIRGCCPGNPQVSRRILAGIDDLISLTQTERHPPLLRHRELLHDLMIRTTTEPDRSFALAPDRQGIG
ncbi:DUF2254 domain-containing protein [Streptomyces sp. NPDC014891]|uniref:DUF2254 domain-containing protein n=1 Tax=Streptomyces sp. NPDC014891 TaxID=3364929 RepID=UPI0036FAF13A